MTDRSRFRFVGKTSTPARARLPAPKCFSTDLPGNSFFHVNMWARAARGRGYSRQSAHQRRCSMVRHRRFSRRGRIFNPLTVRNESKLPARRRLDISTRPRVALGDAARRIVATANITSYLFASFSLFALPLPPENGTGRHGNFDRIDYRVRACVYTHTLKTSIDNVVRHRIRAREPLSKNRNHFGPTTRSCFTKRSPDSALVN